jgi:hypothetical protein
MHLITYIRAIYIYTKMIKELKKSAQKNVRFCSRPNILRE